MDKALAERIISTTLDLLEEHELYGWTIRFSKAYRRIGSCSHQTQTIRISERFAAVLSWEEIHETILHEVAHAIAGPYAGHGPVWRQVARELGIKNPRSRAHVSAAPEFPWVGTCPSGHTTSMVRTPQRIWSCSHCHHSFHEDFLFDWKKNGQKVPMSQKYRAEYASISVLRERQRIGRSLLKNAATRFDPTIMTHEDYIRMMLERKDPVLASA